MAPKLHRRSIHSFADEKNAIRSWPLPPDTTVSVNPSAALAGEQTAAPARRSNADRSRPTKRGIVQCFKSFPPGVCGNVRDAGPI
jgi:hypothetical protein